MKRTEQIADQISILMPAIARRVLLEFFQTIEITQTQMFTIITLYEIAPCRLSALSAQLRIAAPTVTGIVDRLEKLDYVSRVHDKEDRRAVNVVLTAKGTKLAKKLRSTLKEKWHEILSHLPTTDQEDFLALLKKIQGGLK